jgi:nucleolar complex protein 2
MKNTAAELYQLAPAQAYQQAFTFIRMLAVHLRGVVRGSTSGKAGENQEAFKAVYNWQYVHCIDFWSQVLAGACSAAGAESPLKPLIYPLVQIALGVVRWVSSLLSSVTTGF